MTRKLNWASCKICKKTQIFKENKGGLSWIWQIISGKIHLGHQLSYLNYYSVHKFIYQTFICSILSGNCWYCLHHIQQVDHHFGEYLTPRKGPGTPAPTFYRKWIVSTWGRTILSLCFQWYSPKDHPEALSVVQVKHLACPPDGGKQGLEKGIRTIEMCSAVKLKVGQHDMQHYVLSWVKSSN